MRSQFIYLIVLALFLFIGCKDSPVEVHQDENLTAELTISPDHVHTLDEITYTVTVTNDHGDVVTDLEGVEVQRKGHGDTEWSGTELSLSGTSFTSTYTFKSSGDYDIRVVGTHTGTTEQLVLYQMDEHMHVGRAHIETGDYRIEYESFPGHIHEGDAATIKFWIYEKEQDATGERPLVGDLSPHIHCANPDGTKEHHDSVTQEATGIYVADHTFNSAGEAHMGIHFTAGNTNIEAEFHPEVSHGH